MWHLLNIKHECASTHPGHISRSELYCPKEAENDRDDVDEVCEYWSPLVSEEIEYLSFQDADLETKQRGHIDIARTDLISILPLHCIPAYKNTNDAI